MALMMKKSAVVLAIAGVAAAQSPSVVTVFFPGADSQALLGSVITSDASKTTMAVACAGTDDDACGFTEAVTVTVGPSTFHAEEAFESTSVVLNCEVTGTTEAVCEETYVGPAALLATDLDSLTASDATINTAITTTAVTTTLSASEIVYIAVTLTSDLGNASSNTASESGSTASGSTASATGSTTSSATGSSDTGASSTTSSGSNSGSSSGNAASRADSRWFAGAAAGTGLIGLMILLL